mmetsp:Transcript_18788/g.45239  ORF Transcript_18788/g.45239 Transcript_18788/m.45239 type:complete len:220 (+) Transcript_18788:1417-2076(+)
MTSIRGTRRRTPRIWQMSRTTRSSSAKSSSPTGTCFKASIRQRCCTRSRGRWGGVRSTSPTSPASTTSRFFGGWYSRTDRCSARASPDAPRATPSSSTSRPTRGPRSRSGTGTRAGGSSPPSTSRDPCGTRSRGRTGCRASNPTSLRGSSRGMSRASSGALRIGSQCGRRSGRPPAISSAARWRFSPPTTRSKSPSGARNPASLPSPASTRRGHVQGSR